MTLVHKLHNSFTSGEVSPAVYSRTDFSKYESSCRLIENAIVLPQGGVTKRGGLDSVCMLPELEGDEDFDYSASVMFPFTYNVEQSCVLLFLPGRVRVIAHGAEVRGDGGEPVEIATPYDGGELRDLSVCQSADVMFIAHPAHPPMKLMRLSSNLRKWKLEPLSVTPSVSPPGGLSAVEKNWGTAVTDEEKLRPTYYRVSAQSDSGEESMPSDEAVVNLQTTWKAGAKVVLSWNRVEGAVRYHVYKNASGMYGWIGTTEKLTFTDVNIEGDTGVGYKHFRNPFLLDRNNSTTLAAPGGVAASASPAYDGTASPPAAYGGKYYRYAVLYYKVCAVTSSGGNGLASEYQASGKLYVNEGTDAKTESKRRSTYQTLEEARAAAASSDMKPTVTVSWNAVTGAEKYLVFAAVSHDGEYVKVGESTGTSFTDSLGNAGLVRGIEFDMSYPGVVSMMQQRLVFARSNIMPQTVWFSETGAFNSFSEHYPLIDSDAISATIDSRQVNEIRHIVALKNALVMTSAAEYAMGGKTSGDRSISPSSLSIEQQSCWGCSKVPPITAGIDVLFVSNSGRKVRNMQYKFTEDGFVGNELSILAEHLLRSPIVDWAYQKEPNGAVWCCTEDGRLLSMTYLPEQSIVAWSRHSSPLGAKFRSCCVIHENGEDVLYCLVERSAGCFVERMDNWRGDRLECETGFLDCCCRTGIDLEVNGSAFKEKFRPFAGLAVTVVECGVNAYENVTVNPDGSIDVPGAGGGHYVVGFPFSMRVQTSNPELTSGNGTLVANKRRIVSCTVDVENTQGTKVGCDFGHLVVMDYPPPAVPCLKSGLFDVTQLGNFSPEAMVCIENSAPYPCTIRSVEAVIDVSGY